MLSWRLGAAAPVTYAYDGIGNVISKAGASYDYAPQTPWNGGPHAVKAVDGQPYRYDRIGNLSSGGGRRYSWNSENLPTTVTGRDGVTETYGYNADSERVTRTRSGVATIYAEGLWEETVGGRAKSFYSFHGHIVAVREGSTVTSLHGDHLGSISVATTSTAGGPQAPSQEFDTWGRVRSGGINQTSLNYTGHPLDLTGLLNAGARLYDPELARFVSADTVVPAIGGCCCSSTGGLENPNGRKSLAVKQGKGHARSPGGRGATSLGSDSGADDNHRTGALIQDASVLVEKGVIAAKCGPSTIMPIDEGGRAFRPLTVAFYEPDLLAASNAENGTVLREGFRFDGQGTDPLQGPLSMALLIPQALNRYEYALNNPLRHVDPTGHSLCGLFVEAACVAGAAAICVAVGALCTLGTIISVGGLLLPCTGVVMASCGLAAWDAVMCTAVLTQEICGERIFGAPASGSPASGGGVGGSW